MSLKINASKNILWTAIDKISYQLLAFILNIILARILTPHDFGLVGAILIFILIAQVFINSGFSVRIQQYQNINDTDLSTIFYFNLTISLLMYIILYFLAPWIAQFYKEIELVKIIRIMAFSFILMALGLVQTNLFNRNFKYKYIFTTNIIALSLSYSLAVYLAYHNYQVWAIVFQNLSYNFVTVVLLWIFSPWRPLLKFSYTSFKNHFSFGSKLLLTGIYATSLNNLVNVLVGRIYNTIQLGYYTRGLQLVDVPTASIANTITQATIPLLSKYQYNYQELILIFRKLVRFSSFITFPMLLLISVLSKPIVIVLLSEKWLAVVPLLQLLCIYKIWYPLAALNMQLLTIIGRSDWFLYLDLAKAPLIIASILFSFPYGIYVLIISNSVVALIIFIAETIVTHKIFNYKWQEQLKDLSPFLLIGLSMYLLVLFSLNFIHTPIYQLIFGIIIGLGIYFMGCWLFLAKELKYYFISFKEVVGWK